MKKLHQILAVTLLAQVLLAAGVWRFTRPQPVTTTDLIAEFQPGAVTRVEIAQAPFENGEPVVLEKREERWIVVSSNGFPGDAEKIDKVLEALDSKVRSPLASNAGHHDRLGVSEAKAQRKVTLKAGTEPIVAWIAPGSRAGAHVRIEGSDAVYRVKGLQPWTFSAESGNYHDTRYINVDGDTVSFVQIQNEQGEIKLRKTGETWALEPRVADTEIDSPLAGAFARAVARVQMKEVVGTTVLPEHGLEEANVRVTVETTGGDRVSYRVGAKKGEEDLFYLRRDDLPFVVLTDGWATFQARTKALADFFKVEEDKAETTTSELDNDGSSG